jgi:predicted small metal-binding protein
MASSQRKVIDCRLHPSESNCTLTIAGTEEEVLDAAVHHAITKHGHKVGPELRQKLRSLLKAEK